MAYPSHRGHPQNGYNNYDPPRSAPLTSPREYQNDEYGGQYQQDEYGYDNGYNQGYNQGQRPRPQQDFQQRPPRQQQGYSPQGRPPPQRGPGPGYGRDGRGPMNGQQHGGYSQNQQRRPPPSRQQNGYDNGYQEQYQDQYDSYNQRQYDDQYQQDNYNESPQRHGSGSSGHRGYGPSQHQNGYNQRPMNGQGGPRKPPPGAMNSDRRPMDRGPPPQQRQPPDKSAWDQPLPPLPLQQKQPQRPSTANGRYQEQNGSRAYGPQSNGLPDRRQNNSVPNQHREPQSGYDDPRTMFPPQPDYARAPQRSNTMPTDIAEDMSNLDLRPQANSQRQAPQHLNFSQPRRPSGGTQSGGNSRHQSQSTQGGQAGGYDDFLDSYAEEPEIEQPFASPGNDDMPDFGATRTQGIDKTLHITPPTPGIERGRQDHQDFRQQAQRSRSQPNGRGQSSDRHDGYGQVSSNPVYNQNDQQYPPRNGSAQGHRISPQRNFDGQSEFGPPARAQTDAYGPGQAPTRNPSDPYQRAPSRGMGSIDNSGLPGRNPSDPYTRAPSRGMGAPNGPGPTAPLPAQPIRNGTPVGRNGTPIMQGAAMVNGQRTSADSFNAPRPGTAPAADSSRMASPDSLPGHPVPVRPGLMGNPPNPLAPAPRAGPTPVRNYNGGLASSINYSLAPLPVPQPRPLPTQQVSQQQTPPPQPYQQQPNPILQQQGPNSRSSPQPNPLVQSYQHQAPPQQSYQQQPNPLAQSQYQPISQSQPSDPGLPDDEPITYEELQRLRGQVQLNPIDQALQLRLAKRMVEAATSLADEGGRADARTKRKNQERYAQDAGKIVKKLVAANYTEAMFYMAECYGSGALGLNKDPSQAFTLYQSAAKLNHAGAAYRVAVCCELGADEGGGTKRDPLKAVQWYQRAAMLGDVPAMYKTGVIQLKGLLGQPQNPGEAITWLKKAAEQADAENPHALHELALLYMSGGPNNSVQRDDRYAADLMCQAADLNYKFSQFKLGEAYEFGYMGFPIDPRQSITWYSKAATQEEHKSELALSGWYLTGAEGLMASNEQEAYLWAKKAANSGLAKAEYAMGYFTETGIGCQADIEGAKRWYWKAASQNFPKARERLENLRRGGPKMQKARVSRTAFTQQQGDCKMM